MPLILTYSRIATIPLIIVCYYLNWRWGDISLAAILFTLAALTDWLDGFWARRYDQVTMLGAFLDPVADKIMVCALLIVLVEVYHNFWITTAAIVIIMRELVISALREWMASNALRQSVAVSWLGKVKTFLQLVALIGLLSVQHTSPYALYAQLVLWLASLLTIISMIMYCYQAWRALRGRTADIERSS